MRAPMRLNSGRLVDLAHPTLADVLLHDVAFHLAGINRWTGASRFTVAQHCVLVYRISGEPWGLLHDVEETFVGDISQPMKSLLGEALRMITRPWSAAVSHRFCIAQTDVKRADNLVAQLEANYIWPEQAQRWVFDPDDKSLPEEAAKLRPIVPWSPSKAALVWLFEAKRLGLE